MRNDAAIEPAANYVNIKTKDAKGNLTKPYREGFICPDCGKPHQAISSTAYKIVDDKEVAIHETHTMTVKEWGTRDEHQAQLMLIVNVSIVEHNFGQKGRASLQQFC